MGEKKILIVDDDEDIVCIITKMLDGRGWTIIPAFSGEEALKVIAAQKPDVALLDVMMPEMNGLEVLKEARKMDPTVRIIMITAFGDVETYLDSMELGAFEYINKPFESQELVQMIEKVIA